MTSASSDLRRTLRSLTRSPLLTLVAILSIGFAIGAITSVFSWLNAVVLHPFPVVRDPDRVVGLEVAGPDGDGWPLSFPTIREWRRDATSLSDVAAWSISRVSVRERGAQSSQALLSMPVSGNYFGLLGVRPIAGRTIETGDESSIKPVAVLAHAFWMRQYAGDRSIIGRTIYANGVALEIVGIAPPRFSGTYVGVIPDMFVPITLHPGLTGANVLEDRRVRVFQALGRLRPGVTPLQAQRQLDALARRLSAAAGDRPVTGAIVKDIRTQYLGGLMLPLFVAMLGVSALLLLVACANVASLMLMRAGARSHEIALRLALGASRPRVAALSMIETGAIALLGGVLAVLVSLWARGLLVRIIPTESLPLTLPVTIDARVMLLAMGLVAMVAIVSGLIPALRATRTPAASALRAGARSLARGASTARTGIVGAQIALSLACLALASLFIDGLREASRVDLGFRDPEHVLVVTTNLAAAHLDDTTGQNAIHSIIERAAALPGVQSATVATYVPLGLGGRPVADLKIEGFSPMPDQNMSAMRIGTGPGYETLMHTRIVAGRDILPTDRSGTLAIAVVNETFSRRFFPGGSAIGHRVDAGHGWCTIVGVVADGKYGSLSEHAQPVLYYAIAQWYQPLFNVYVRTAGDPLALAEPVRRMLQSVHIDIPALQPRTLAEHIAGATFVQRTGASVLASFGAAALVLSLIGLYGALAIAIAQRRRELGIRLTLGAPRSSIVWLVLRQGLLIASIGVAAGIPLALALGGVLRSRFESLGALSTSGLLAGAAIVATAAALAALTPALRALAVDPIEVMRAET